MDDRKKRGILFILVLFAGIVLIAVGATFAYFSASISSANNAVSVGAAMFTIDFDDDISLIKGNVIPSIEEYVDIASKRVDGEGNFLKPYEDAETGETVIRNTACIDDNLNEICSMYTFTISNSMTSNDLPLYITLNTSVNTFENLYFKVLDSNLNEVISATHLVDDREYTLDGENNKVYASGSTISPVVLTNINKTLPKAIDAEHPSSVTYTIVMWIMETNTNQNTSDGGKVFASTLHVSASGPGGTGITGVISAAGTE